MNFAKRAFSGAALTLVTAGLLGVAGWQLHVSMNAEDGKRRPPARERLYSVEVGTLTQQSVKPTIVAYGQVQAWNSLEIRAPASGPVTEISSNFRNGRSVNKGDLLFRIDPDIAARRVVDAEAALSQAWSEQQEATLSLAHVKAEVVAAQRQVKVRLSDLTRKKRLADKKLIAMTLYEEAALALSAAEQAVIAKQQAVLAMQSRITKADAGVKRAELTLSNVKKALSETAYRAPFTGRLSDVSVTLGRRLSQNEKLGLLIDPDALEVSFPIRNAVFGSLLDPSGSGTLLPQPISATLDLPEAPITVAGVLDRSAAVASSQAGRTVYARLDGKGGTAMRPGDFVTVSIAEPQIDNVAVIPAGAVTDRGRILLVDDDNRLTEHVATIVRRQAETTLVSGVPFGARYVKLRQPYLGAGVKIKPRDRDTSTLGTATAASPAQSGTESAPLDENKRAEMIAHVKASKRMPERRRARILKELEKPSPSRRIVERIKRQMARRRNRS